MPIIVLISFYVQFYESSEHAVQSIEHVTNKTLKNHWNFIRAIHRLLACTCSE